MAKTIKLLLIIAFIIIYPMLIATYVTLPLFIGYAGYLLVLGFEGRGWKYILLPLLYLINLEINLSLPLLLSFIGVLLFYIFIYDKLLILKRCRVCVAVLSVIFIDFIYLLSILGYDFIFDTNSIILNSILLYSLFMDMIVAVIL